MLGALLPRPSPLARHADLLAARTYDNTHPIGVAVHHNSAADPAGSASTWSRGLDTDHRLVFDPSDSTRYAVNVVWCEEDQGFRVANRAAIVTLEGVNDLSAADLALDDHIIRTPALFAPAGAERQGVAG